MIASERSEPILSYLALETCDSSQCFVGKYFCPYNKSSCWFKYVGDAMMALLMTIYTEYIYIYIYFFFFFFNNYFCADFYTLYQYKLRISNQCILTEVAVIFTAYSLWRAPLFPQRI